MPHTDHRDFPFTFSCRRSGNCCSIPGGVVRVTAEERGAIAEHLGLSEAAFASRYLTPGGDRLVSGPSSRCVLLEDGATASCSIYPVRPEKCRSWPYWSALKNEPERLRRAAAMCPGLELADEGDETR